MENIKNQQTQATEEQAHGFAQGIKWAADLLKANEIVAAELQKGGAAYV